MNTYLVGIKFEVSEIQLDMVTADNWKDALRIALSGVFKLLVDDEDIKHLGKSPEDFATMAVDELSDDMVEAKMQAINNMLDFNVRQL